MGGSEMMAALGPAVVTPRALIATADFVVRLSSAKLEMRALPSHVAPRDGRPGADLQLRLVVQGRPMLTVDVPMPEGASQASSLPIVWDPPFEELCPPDTSALNKPIAFLLTSTPRADPTKRAEAREPRVLGYATVSLATLTADFDNQTVPIMRPGPTLPAGAAASHPAGGPLRVAGQQLGSVVCSVLSASSHGARHAYSAVAGASKLGRPMSA
eukprot:7039707-Prymnesium_polylepis.1